MKTGTFIVGIALCTIPGLAQIRINLDHLAPKAEKTVDITLSAEMLGMASRFFSGAKDGDAQKMQRALAGLKAITVRSYQFAREGEYKQTELDPIRSQLAAPGWTRVVSERSAQKSSEIFARTEQGKMAGFTVLSAEPKELTVISIEGAVDLADLAGVRGMLGIPANLLPNQDTKAKGKQ